MSLRRRASIAGADFKKDYLNRSGNGFGRRLSLASLGQGKYGRAEDRELVVRHIPIVIEGREDRDEIGADKSHDEGVRSHRSPKSISVPINIVTMADGVWTREGGDRRPHSVSISRSRGDRSSTSSTESDNSVDVSTSRRKNDSELARKWQKLKSSSNSDNNSQQFPSTFLRSPPVNELTQKRHTMSSARKTRGEPGVVFVKETVGADQCPVHGHHHHHCHDDDGGKLRAPPLVRSNSAADERHKRHSGGRPRHMAPALAPIKENIAQENNKSNSNNNNNNKRPSSSLERFSRQGSFREARNIKTEAVDQDNTSSRPFHRRWSMRLPSAQPKTVHILGDHHSRHPMPGVDTEARGPQEVIQPRHQTKGDPSGANEASAQRGGVNNSVNFSDEKITLGNSFQETPVKACVGILKTPGRRKTSNNRVEFLDNLQEREIPGRYT